MAQVPTATDRLAELMSPCQPEEKGEQSSEWVAIKRDDAFYRPWNTLFCTAGFQNATALGQGGWERGPGPVQAPAAHLAAHRLGAGSRQGTCKASAPQQLGPTGPVSLKAHDCRAAAPWACRTPPRPALRMVALLSIRHPCGLSFSNNPEFLQGEFAPRPGARPRSEVGPSALLSWTGRLQLSGRTTKQLHN